MANHDPTIDHKPDRNGGTDRALPSPRLASDRRTNAMPEVVSGHSTPAPLNDRYVTARTAVAVTLNIPVTRNRHRTVTGALLGAMFARGEVHHYRIRGDNSAVYFAPGSWLAPDCAAAVIAATREPTEEARKMLPMREPEGVA